MEGLQFSNAVVSEPSMSRGKILGGIPPAMYTPPVARTRRAALEHSEPRISRNIFKVVRQVLQLFASALVAISAGSMSSGFV